MASSTTEVVILPEIAGDPESPDGDDSLKGKPVEDPVGDPDPAPRPAVPDGGWGWMVVLGAFLSHVIMLGLSRSMGIVLTALLERYEHSVVVTALVFSMYNTLRMILGPVASLAADRFSCRACLIAGSLVASVGFVLSAFTTELYHLYLTYGLLAGIGGGFIFSPMYIIVSKYFDKHKGKAMSVATLGGGVGTLVISPLLTFLLEQYSLFGTFLVMGALVLNCAVGGALFRPLPVQGPGPEKGPDTPASTKSVKPGPPMSQKLALLKNRTFMLFGTNMMAIPFCVQGPLLFLPALGQELGASPTRASLLLGVAGISDVVGRFFMGLVFDTKLLRHRRRLPHSIVGITLGLVIICWGLVPNYYALAAVVALWGFFEAGYHGQRLSVLSEFVPKEQIPFAVGMGIFFQGVGSISAPLTAGLIRDHFGSFTVCYFYYGTLLVVVCSLFLLEYIFCYRKRRNLQEA